MVKARVWKICSSNWIISSGTAKHQLKPPYCRFSSFPSPTVEAPFIIPHLQDITTMQLLSNGTFLLTPNSSHLWWEGTSELGPWKCNENTPKEPLDSCMLTFYRWWLNQPILSFWKICFSNWIICRWVRHLVIKRIVYDHFKWMILFETPWPLEYFTLGFLISFAKVSGCHCLQLMVFTHLKGLTNLNSLPHLWRLFPPIQPPLAPRLWIRSYRFASKWPGEPYSTTLLLRVLIHYNVWGW